MGTRGSRFDLSDFDDEWDEKQKKQLPIKKNKKKQLPIKLKNLNLRMIKNISKIFT
jgi:hypothetical protein